MQQEHLLHLPSSRIIRRLLSVSAIHSVSKSIIQLTLSVMGSLLLTSILRVLTSSGLLQPQRRRRCGVHHCTCSFSMVRICEADGCGLTAPFGRYLAKTPVEQDSLFEEFTKARCAAIYAAIWCRLAHLSSVHGRYCTIMEEINRPWSEHLVSMIQLHPPSRADHVLGVGPYRLTFPRGLHHFGVGSGPFLHSGCSV